MQPGDLLWTPGPEWIRRANLTAFTDWLARERGQQFADYTALWRWSVEDLEGFWGALWDYFHIEASVPYRRVLGRRGMPGAEWFPGAQLNYAQHVMRRESGGGDVLLHVSETRPLTALSWDTLGNRVRTLATQLRALGVVPGDRVVAWMPNIPETMIAMLATTAIGAIWACCSPDFGERGTLDRLAQLSPKLLFGIDGYRYGGKSFDRREELRHIAANLPSLEHLVYLPYLNPDDATLPVPAAVHWHTLLDRPAVSAAQFRYEQVPFDHPLWTLFSSGTTGLPKPIVHGHGGILLEIL
jgi:acetoacetyl-CoA synthetase